MATQKEVAEHIDLSARQIRNLVKSGVLPAAVGKGLDLDACRLAYVRYLRGRATRQVAEPTGELDSNEELARLRHYQANIAALDEREKSGELVRRDDVVAEVSEAIANCRARLLSLPAKLSTVVAALEHPQEIRGALQAGIHEALDELYTTYADHEPSGEGVEEPADPDGQ